jgi:hypothetical protein
MRASKTKINPTEIRRQRYTYASNGKKNIEVKH